jgi:hypothetical protein
MAGGRKFLFSYNSQGLFLPKISPRANEPLHTLRFPVLREESGMRYDYGISLPPQRSANIFLALSRTRRPSCRAFVLP